MSDKIGTGTAQGVIDYLDSLVSKGRSRDGVVTPLKTALTKVLEKTEGKDKWPETDVTSLDLDDTMSRFKNLTLTTYTEASYRAYHSRTQRAIMWYKSFLENPGWAPPLNAKKSNVVKDNGSVNVQQRQKINSPPAGKSPDNSEARHTNVGTQKSDSDDVNMIAYPFPLTDGNIARLYLPKKVSKLDAQRLSSFINALILEEVSQG